MSVSFIQPLTLSLSFIVYLTRPFLQLQWRCRSLMMMKMQSSCITVKPQFPCKLLSFILLMCTSTAVQHKITNCVLYSTTANICGTVTIKTDCLFVNILFLLISVINNIF